MFTHSSWIATLDNKIILMIITQVINSFHFVNLNSTKPSKQKTPHYVTNRTRLFNKKKKKNI